MPVTPLRKASVFVFGILVLAALALGAAGRAAAAQGAPSWATGDNWVYTPSGGNGTLTWTVLEQTTVSVTSGTYNAWHVAVATTSGSVSFTIDSYLTVDGLKTVKTSGTILVLITTTYSPPMPTADFPLTVGKMWQGTSSVTTMIGSISNTVSDDWNGTVTGETSVTVPAGTFTAAVIRTPASGEPHDVNYYSETVGWMVKTEHYSALGTLTSSESLASYKYSGNTLLLILIVIGILVIVAAAGVVLLRRRKPRMPQAMPPQGYPPQQPYYPPQQPPQQPPQSPPGP